MTEKYFTNADRGNSKRKNILMAISLAAVMAGSIALFEFWGGFSSDVARLVDTPQAEAQTKSAPKAEKNGNLPRKSGEKAIKPDQKEMNRKSKENLSVGQLAIEDLSEKRDRQDRERFVESKMSEIQADILKQLSGLRDLQRQMDDQLKSYNSGNKKEKNLYLAKLIKIVGSMRSENASEVLSQLDEDLAVTIMASLSGAKSSKIMGNMKSDKAASLGAKMVELKPEPELKKIMEEWKDVIEKEKKNDKSKRFPKQK